MLGRRGRTKKGRRSDGERAKKREKQHEGKEIEEMGKSKWRRRK